MTGNIPFTWWEIQASSQTLSIAALPLASQQRRWSRATNPRLVTPYSMGHWLPNCLIFFPFFFPDLTSLLWNVFVKIFSSSPTNDREFDSMIRLDVANCVHTGQIVCLLSLRLTPFLILPLMSFLERACVVYFMLHAIQSCSLLTQLNPEWPHLYTKPSQAERNCNQLLSKSCWRWTII